jgi:hypothetical protein
VGSRVGNSVGLGLGGGDGVKVGTRAGDSVGKGLGGGDGVKAGKFVGARVGGKLGEGVVVGTRVGTAVGIDVGFGQISSAVAEQVEAEASHAVAPQHAKGVVAVQAEHNEVSLRSAGPAQPKQSRVPVPA